MVQLYLGFHYLNFFSQLLSNTVCANQGMYTQGPSCSLLKLSLIDNW